MTQSTTRRRFVQGVAATGAAAAVGISDARAAVSAGPLVLQGPVIDLVIARTPVNITGRDAVATAINGQVPGPTLLWREGDTVTLNVTNRLAMPTSIHWHGINPPYPMDGVPGVSYPGIAPGATFTYRIPVDQFGTYGYHSHSGLQEQTGVFGPIIVAPKQRDPFRYDREHVILLSDWSDDDPETVLSNLKFDSDYYNHNQRTVGTFISDASRNGLRATLADRWAWGGMRMSPTDLADVTGSHYTYLVNGQSPATNWTGLFRPGERVRLRFINGAAMTFFDVRVPGLRMTVVAADGNNVKPVEVDEFRFGPAETYDVIVEPGAGPAHTIFAQAQDRTGFARGTLAVRDGVSAPVPAMDPRPIRTMVEMGMGGMAGGGMAGSGKASNAMPGMAMGASPAPPSAAGRSNGSMDGMAMDAAPMPPPSGKGMGGLDTDGGRVRSMGVGVDNVAVDPTNRLNDPGIGLAGHGRQVLAYQDLRALAPFKDQRPPSREITLHLTGNMDRYMWGFDGKKYSEAPAPIRLALNERVRFVLINDTMMEHPIHLHGLYMQLDNGNGAFSPLMHTIVVKGGERLSYLVTADNPGKWAYHCHLAYHIDSGMLRVVSVT